MRHGDPLGGGTCRDLQPSDRFWVKVDKHGPHFEDLGRCWEDQVGLIPAQHDLHHRCGNTRCVNPDHLSPLSRAEHVREDKRANTGKLTRAQVRAIRASHEPHAALGRRYGVSWQMVQEIRSGRKWRGVA